jgi:hypothetical protein
MTRVLDFAQGQNDRGWRWKLIARFEEFFAKRGRAMVRLGLRYNKLIGRQAGLGVVDYLVQPSTVLAGFEASVRRSY